MSRLQCLGKSSNGSQKQLAVEVTSAQAETHKVNGRMGKKTVTDKPCRSLPARTLPCSVQVSGKETQKPKSPSRGVLNTEACSPKESINIKPRGEEPAESTAAPDEELKMKDSSNTWPSDSAGIGGRTHAPPPVEPVSMHEPNEEEEQTKEDDAEDEDLKAPVELKIEFLGALMDKDFQLAHKLCQMILIHEPDNPEASEFLPLIHKKLLEVELFPSWRSDNRGLMATSEPRASGGDQDPNSANLRPPSTTNEYAWMHGCTRKLGMKICGFLQKNNSLEEKGRLAGQKNLLSCDNSDRDARFRHTETDFSNLFARDLLPAKNGEEPTIQFLLEVVDILTNYVKKTFDRSTKVLDFHHPHQLLEGMEGFNLELSEQPESLEQILVDCRDTLKYGVRTGHPRFFNQLSSGLDIIGLAGEWLTSTANTNMFTYEIAPVFVLMEQLTLKKMREMIGWPDGEGDGLFSPGGAISNMYSVMIARYKYFPEVKTKGMSAAPRLVLFTSEHSHYSIKKAGAALGFGTENVILLSTDERGRVIPADLEAKIIDAKQKGYVPLFVNATAGSTVYGAFDPINEIADICEKYNLWLHVDGAWGGGLLMSRKHRHKLSGVERANSVTWNPHKMMGVPLQCSAILVREKGIMAGCNSMCAGYLFQPDKQYDVTYDTGDKAIQCGRHVDIFKFWLMWKAKGTIGFEQHIDKCLDLSQYLYNKIKNREGYEMVFDGVPQHTNVCFWYIPPSLRGMPDGDERREKLHRVAPKIKAMMMESGTTMVGYQPQGNKVNFFRMVVSNPAATQSDIDFLIDEIERMGHDL
ncbi:glutamate decarboxylase 1-like isoform X2 [Seriola aureovittata]|uniref:glutamate decarboxylase 1-like isoform X2 n=1 Tax=Seriola aureovittata TaxID=2871759 RepID=UPI0024BDC57F|nr:glutamate decarboxylase 1-like isoform X2 [Seriola aureovittata]